MTGRNRDVGLGASIVHIAVTISIRRSGNWHSMKAIETQRRVISPRLRQAILDRHYGGNPSAAESTLGALTLYLYAPESVDTDSGEPLLCARTMAKIEGQQVQHRLKNYVAQDLFRRYREVVDSSFQWSQYDMKRRCRRATQFDHDPELLAESREPSASGEMVYVSTGEPVTEASRKEDLRALRRVAEVRSNGVVDDRIRDFLQYLNGLPPNRFTTAVRRHHDDARAAADRALASGEINPAQHAAALADMAALVAQPVPIYVPSDKGRTSRIFPYTPGLLTLRSAFSAIYRSDSMTYDLMCCHAAVNAVDWGAIGLEAFLFDYIDHQGALWNYLYEIVGVDIEVLSAVERMGVKGEIKTAFYSVVYGKAVRKIRVELNKGLAWAVDRAGDRFVDGAHVRELLECRDARLAEVKRRGGLVGGFGEWIGLEPGRRAESLLADRAQGVEFSLLLPAIDLAKATTRWDISLWQHDGFDVLDP